MREGYRGGRQWMKTGTGIVRQEERDCRDMERDARKQRCRERETRGVR